MRAAWYDLQGPATEVLHSAVKVSRNFPSDWSDPSGAARRNEARR